MGEREREGGEREGGKGGGSESMLNENLSLYQILKEEAIFLCHHLLVHQEKWLQFCC